MSDSGIMDHQHPGNLLADSAGHGAARAAELGGMLLMAAQHAVRIREQRLQAGLDNDQQAATVARTQLRTEYAADRVQWAPALERDYATSSDAMRAWTSAQPWVDHDVSAAEAATRAEARLGVLHPELMDQYRAYRAEGMGANEAMLEAGRTVSQHAWQPAVGHCLTNMDVEPTLEAWNAARPWANGGDYPSDRSREAAQAMANAEERLRQLRPAAMAGYDEARAAGVDPLEAMQSVAPALREQVWDSERVENTPFDPGAAQAARTLAVEERGDAQRDFAVPDQASTPNVDEHAVGVHEGAVHEEVAVVSGARASQLASQSYPHSVHLAVRSSGTSTPAGTPGAQVVQQSAGRRR